MPTEAPRLVTQRLVLEVPEPDAAPRVIDYFVRNKAHLAPWDPPRPATFLTEAFWKERLAQSRLELLNDQSARFFVSKNGVVVGAVNFTNIVRGPFQACMLGYSIDGELEGQGYMSEAVRAGLGYAFATLKLHRVMANHIPENVRSARLLKKLGFAVEGYARDYLFIDGAWRDHVLTALTNHELTRP
jgi:[ribosomal protein S5]-alanine N-acetyltransferase